MNEVTPRMLRDAANSLMQRSTPDRQRFDADVMVALRQAAGALERRAGAERSSLPDDIRAAGWTVAIHNDYRQDGKLLTFWLFTRDGRAVKGEGRSDAEALDVVRADLFGR